MKDKDYHAILRVDASPHEVFENINSVTKWWTENLEGSSQKLNDEFSVRFGDIHYSKQKLVEFIPDKKVVWLVTDSHLNFVKEKSEWTGTKISFEISEHHDCTKIKFIHFGLLPTIECYGGCSQGWDQYIKESLFKLLTEGKGEPGLK